MQVTANVTQKYATPLKGPANHQYHKQNASGQKKAHKMEGGHTAPFSPGSGMSQIQEISPTGINHPFSPHHHSPQSHYGIGSPQSPPMHGYGMGHSFPMGHPYHQPTPESLYQQQLEIHTFNYGQAIQAVNYQYASHRDQLVQTHKHTKAYEEELRNLDEWYTASRTYIDIEHGINFEQAKLQYEAMRQPQYMPHVSMGYMPNASYASADQYAEYPATPQHHGSSMSPLGGVKASKLGHVGKSSAKALNTKTGGGKLSEAEALLQEFQALAINDKPSLKESTTPPRTMLQRATSDGQTMTDAMKTFITPTTAHILSQVPAKYPELFEELETLLSSPETKSHMASQNLTGFMQTIHNTIMRSFYSQVTDREGYGNSKTPSPTTLLTVIYEIREKKQIKNKDHAQKLGITLRNIKEIMTTLRLIRDDQKDTPDGARLSELAKIFVAFFNKIGILSVEALQIYESKLATSVAHTNLPELHTFFQEESVANDQVFELYTKQTDKKLYISTYMTPKKLQFKEKAQDIATRLNTDPNQFINPIASLIDAALTKPSAKLSQKERKAAERAARLAKKEASTPPALDKEKAATVRQNKDIDGDANHEENTNDVSFDGADLGFLREEY